MKNRWSVALLSLVVLTLTAAAPASAAEICAPPQAQIALSHAFTPAPVASATFKPNSACQAWVETTYFTSAAETTQVGRCTITCHQFDTGDAEPTFSAGGTCTGASSSFYSQFFTACPCPP